MDSGKEVGSSLIDYVLASADAFPLIQSLTILPAPESDHAALHLIISRTPAWGFSRGCCGTCIH